MLIGQVEEADLKAFGDGMPTGGDHAEEPIEAAKIGSTLDIQFDLYDERQVVFVEPCFIIDLKPSTTLGGACLSLKLSL
jgi:hypothetical protein